MSTSKLLDQFKKIAKERWIPSCSNHINGVGLTFEQQLGKKSDSMFFPDYKGIEIKCSQRYSKYPISLFSLSFDGPGFYEMHQLLEKYRVNDYEYTNRKLLISQLRVNEKILVNHKYFFELKVNKRRKLVYLNIYDQKNNLIEEGPYIKFETINTRLHLKLSTLALICASKKEINNAKFFRYYHISFYKLKENIFIDLLKRNDILVEIVGRVSRSGPDNSRQRNKNLVFSIQKEKIDLLFEKYIDYNHDTNNNLFANLPFDKNKTRLK